MSVPGKIGQNIVALRRKKGMTQEALALDSKLSVSHLRHIEHGTGNPTVGTLCRVTETLNTTLSALVEGAEEDREPSDKED